MSLSDTACPGTPGSHPPAATDDTLLDNDFSWPLRCSSLRKGCYVHIAMSGHFAACACHSGCLEHRMHTAAAIKQD